MADDLGINFSKWFSKKETSAEKPSEGTPGSQTPDAGLDISKLKNVGNWCWDHRAWFLVLIPILLSIIVRIQPVDVPLADVSAGNQVSAFIRDDIQRSFDIQYPNLPQQNRARLVEEEFQKSIRQPYYTVRTGSQQGQSFNLEQQRAAIANDFRSFFQYEANGKSFTYMPDIDPYTYLRWARNYLATGDMADERRNGVAYDNHMVAPLGAPIDDTIHPYVLAWTYRVMSVFSRGITLMQAAGYFPVIMIALSVIPVYFIGRRFGGTTAGFFAATVFGINAALLGRTNWGHADTDAYNVFFPVLILWLFLESYYHKSIKARLALIGGAGLATGLFAVTWSGWWYIFDFVLAIGGAYLVYLLWMHRAQLKQGIGAFLKTNEIKQHAVLVLGYIIAAGLFVSLFISFGSFVGAPLQPFDFISIKDAAKISLFPNVLTTVAELNEASLEQVIDQMGHTGIGIPLFAIAVLGLLLLALPREKYSLRDLAFLGGGLIYYWIIVSSINRFSPVTFILLFALPIAVLVLREMFKGICTFDIKLVLFLVLWFMATMYASTKGIRFVMLLVPAFSIAFGVGIGLATQALSRWAHASIKVPPVATASVIITLFVLVLAGPAQQVAASSANDLPIINDAWYNTLTSIRDASQPTAIITSWWDFGHHFKYLADRRVTFDGASQNEPMAHWVGKILLTDDEELAVGLLRMLDCGSTKAFDVLDKEIKDASITVKRIYETVRLPKDQAAKLLREHGISESTITEYLNYTHCTPPEAFFIASGDMIGKGGVWAHFGSWNFDRADIWVYARTLPRNEAIPFIMNNSDVDETTAEQLYDDVIAITSEQEGNAWIAPWPNYNGDIYGCDKNGDTLNCDNGITIDLQTHDVTIPTQGEQKRPTVFAYPTATGVELKRYSENTVPFSLTLIPRGESYGLVLANDELAASMFTRMYYLQGHGLKYFKPFNVQRDASGLLIYTYQVDWDGTNTTIIPGAVI
ncbi:hypothetical protein HY492_00145 [Candidatus Woesearchaeota archaeon]|nr:hypothetical protein [Candidatus Woesearchaeota archaeon]